MKNLLLNEGSIFNIQPSSISSGIETEDIIKNVERILSCVFHSGEKTRIINSTNRISFACPYCGDSTTNIRKKRGNIYFDGFSYHCYNCETHRSAHRFFEDFNNFLNLEPFELMKYRLIHKIDRKIFNGLDYVLNETISKYSYSKDYLMNYFKYSKIENTFGERYLKNRFQYDMNNFAWDSKTNSIVIFNMDKDNNVIGFQKRILNKNVKNKYINYSINRIYEELNIPIDDTIENLNSISLYFGLLKVDFNDTITVFEGSLDSLLYPNSISMASVTRELPFDSDYIQYWFDFDNAGRNKSKKILLEGESVFLWKKFLNDININPDSVEKLDLTELYKISRLNKLNVDFNKYFSNNKINLIFI